MTVSRARHLGLIAMILLGVFIYVGWRIRKDRATSPIEFLPTATSPLMTTSSPQDRIASSQEAHPSSSPESPSVLTPLAIRDPSAVVQEEIPSPNPPITAETTGLVDLPPPSQEGASDLTPIERPEGMGKREPERPFDTSPLEAVVGEPLPSDAAPIPLPESAGTPPSSSVGKTESPVPPLPTSSSSAPSTLSPGTPPTSVAGRKYTIQYGDTLWTIAQTQYGDGSQWKRIYEANREQIPDPNHIPVGVEITIPSPEP